MVGSSLGSTTVGARERDLAVAGEPGTAISAGARGNNMFGSAVTGGGGALGDVGAKLECAGDVGSYSSSGTMTCGGASAVGTGGSSRKRCRGGSSSCGLSGLQTLQPLSYRADLRLASCGCSFLKSVCSCLELQLTPACCFSSPATARSTHQDPGSWLQLIS